MATVDRTAFGFEFGEVTGAIGDSVTVLPLVVGLGVLTSASLPHMLAGFGIFQVVWGLYYGAPLSVEPMKALAGLAIVGTLTFGELVSAGLLAGAILIAAGRAGALTWIARVVGEPVVRGVQFAVAVLLVVAGLELAFDAPTVAGIGVGIAVTVAVISRRAVALVVLAVGGVWAGYVAGVPTPALPAVEAFPSGSPSLSANVLEGLVAQLAMTVGNAAVATSLLLSDLYDVDVSPDELATSMGITNLAAVPLGGIPMCHGSGGLAGKYAFGARTGTANLVAGLLYGGLAVFAGLLVAFPLALLGILLLLVAASLARVALIETESRLLVVSMGALAMVSNVGVAFVVGAAWWTLRHHGRDVFADGV